MPLPELPIVFEDDSICVIHKPAGIVVNDAQTVHVDTVQSWSRDRFFHGQSGDETEWHQKSGIVHRLDKETSGILVITKTLPAYQHIKSQFMERTVSKTYNTLVHGFLTPTAGEINAPIARLPWNRERFGILAEGREAVTNYSVLTKYQNTRGRVSYEYSFVDVHPKTGRTHQIRVHMKYSGHPVAMDELYCGRKQFRQDKELFVRMMLHARKISFLHPVTEEILELEAPLPPDMKIALDQLREV